MDIVKRKIDSLTPNDKNPRKHSDAQLEELWKSVNKFGSIRPIVVDEKGVILAGHGLWEACKRHDMKEVDVLEIKGLSDKDKKKLLLADNKIYSMGIDNYSAIEEILQELGADNDFEIPGYDASVLEEMYGIKAIEEEVEAEGTPVQKALSDVATDKQPVEPPTPSDRVEEARKEAVAEAEKFVICPNCGEKVYL